MVAVFVDRPKGFAIVGLAVSGMTCVLIGGLILSVALM
jgi:hypothetical protein